MTALDDLLYAMTLVAALGCGLIAGLFFTFSAFVMKALTRIPPAKGIAAMQSINVTVLNPWFFLVFFGTAVACLVLLILAVVKWGEPGSGRLLLGSSLYLAGTVLVTILFNVPQNNRLAAVDASSADGAIVWARYVETWTAWNHVRTVAALAAAASLTLALCQV